MLQSPQLKANPNLHVFLPMFYMVWSDAVLTPSEISAIHQIIDGQGWLKEDEKKFLLSQLNPSSPPSPDEFKRWLEEIRRALDGAPFTSSRLADIGVKVAQLH